MLTKKERQELADELGWANQAYVEASERYRNDPSPRNARTLEVAKTVVEIVARSVEVRERI